MDDAKLEIFAIGDLQLCAYSAMAFAWGYPMREDADHEEIVAAARRILAVTGTGEDD